MGLQRLGISNPVANTNSTIYTANNQYLVSIIATNKSTTLDAQIRVWVEPSGSSAPSEYAYIVYDLTVDASNSFETFRFAVNQNDVIKVRSSSDDVSFQIYGLVQYDVNLGVGISSYGPTAPTNTVDGLIWIDSDATGTGQNKPAYVWDSTAEDWVQFIGGVDESADYTFTGNVVVPGYQRQIPFQSTEPLSPITGDLWIHNEQLILKVYNGVDWVDISGGGGFNPLFLGGT